MQVIKPTFLAVLLMVLGAAMLAYGMTLPYHGNQSTVNQLMINGGTINKKEYYAQEAAFRTSKTTYLDAGSGLLVVAIMLLVFVRTKRMTSFTDLAKLHTLPWWGILLVANVAWLLLIPGTYWYYSYRAMRGDFPPFADSIGIPISIETELFLKMIFPLNVLIVFSMIKSILPAPLLARPVRYDTWAVGWEMIFGITLLCSLLLLGIFIVDGDHISIISFNVLNYLLFSLRAGRMQQLASR